MSSPLSSSLNSPSSLPACCHVPTYHLESLTTLYTNMANNTSLEGGNSKSRRESDGDNITVAQPAVPIEVNNTANRDTEQRIQDLEQKVAEQEKINSDLHDDIKSFKALQNGDRAEFYKRLEYQDLKKKKLFALVGELSNSRELLATKADLRYVGTITR
jgi:hypothetical protein